MAVMVSFEVASVEGCGSRVLYRRLTVAKRHSKQRAGVGEKHRSTAAGQSNRRWWRARLATDRTWGLRWHELVDNVLFKVHLDRIWKQLREEDERHTSKRTVSEQAEAEREAVDAKATEEQAEQKEEEAQPAAEEAQPDTAEEAEQEEEQSYIIDAQVAAAEAQREKRSAEANDGCGILVSGDCSVTGFWRDALGAVPHLGEACVPLSVLSAYCCGSGWLPCWSIRCVCDHQRGQPESAAGSCSNRLL